MVIRPGRLAEAEREGAGQISVALMGWNRSGGMRAKNLREPMSSIFKLFYALNQVRATPSGPEAKIANKTEKHVPTPPLRAGSPELHHVIRNDGVTGRCKRVMCRFSKDADQDDRTSLH